MIKELVKKIMGKHVMITGTRDCDKTAVISRAMDAAGITKDVKSFWHGDARGVDRTAENWFNLMTTAEIHSFPARWDLHGRSAGYKRNENMAKAFSRVKGDKIVVAIPGPKSKGTYHMIDICRSLGLDVYVHTELIDE